MPIFFEQEISADTRLAVWRIEEDEAFFLQHVPLQREITHPHKRLQHLAGRYLLQYLFADFPINLIKIAGTRKPFLEDEAYHFSISHCNNYAAAIVSKTARVGVDIELPTAKVEKIKQKFLHPEELAWQTELLNRQTANVNRETQETLLLKHTSTSQPINLLTCQLVNLSTYQPVNLLTLLWCCKEAVFKWWSYGAVDFSEMIRLQPFTPQEQGTIEGAFITEESHPLQLNYKLFDGVCLAWVVK